MLDLVLRSSDRSPVRILCVGAHCDDIEIGCGATLRGLQRTSGQVVMDWVVLSGGGQRRRETASSMSKFVRPSCRGELRFGDFPDGRFPACYSEIKEFFESLKALAKPGLIFCHEREDRHQDHRIVNEMVWSTFRNHLILEYEIPKWDGGLGQPNVFMPVTRRDAVAKADVLTAVYKSQATREWFRRDTFLSLLRMRGLECRATSGYAEAFHARKIQIGVP